MSSHLLTEVLAEEEHRGLTCVVMRVTRQAAFRPGKIDKWYVAGTPDEWFTGYVRVGRDHPLHGVDWYDPTAKYGTPEHQAQPCQLIEAHGMLNYSGMWPRRDRYRGGWWFGFDMNHSWDQDSPPSLATAQLETRRLAARLASVFVDDDGELRVPDDPLGIASMLRSSAVTRAEWP